MAVVFAFFALVSYWDASDLRDHGVRTRATVTEVHGGKGSYVVVSFTTTTGQEVTAEADNYSWHPRPRVGDVQDIIYDPEDPQLVADVRTGPDFATVWFAAVMAVGSAGLAWPTFTGRINWARRRR